MTAIDSKQQPVDFAKYITEQTHNFTGCEWVFQAIDQWLTDKDAPRFFLIIGEPGSGKTAIAARLIQMSKGQVESPASSRKLVPGFLSAFHFCRANVSDWTDPCTFARSMSLQLTAIPDSIWHLQAEETRRSTSMCKSRSM